MEYLATTISDNLRLDSERRCEGVPHCWTSSLCSSSYCDVMPGKRDIRKEGVTLSLRGGDTGQDCMVRGRKKRELKTSQLAALYLVQDQIKSWILSLQNSLHRDTLLCVCKPHQCEKSD